jgi:predicted DNA-binding protein
MEKKYRKDGKKYTEILKIRVTKELKDRMLAAMEPAGWDEETESAFFRHLLVLGIKEVEQSFVDKIERRQKGDKQEASAGSA